jgi:outer membrane protein assembly factor BamB
MRARNLFAIGAVLMAWQWWPAGAVIAQSKPAAASASPSGGPAWRQWGGPNRNFMVNATGLADKWPEGGPRVFWSRPLGTGHSAILVDEGRLYTMYRVGNGQSTGGGGRAKGPFDAEESVVALEAATGKTIWEHKYPSRREDFSFGAGPHSTPLIVGDRLFTVGTNNQVFAFDKRTGKILWSHDLIKDFNAPELLIRPVVKVGYGCSFIAYRDTIICSVGGPGQSVIAFRQSDGTVAWKSGDFLNSDAAPILINFAGQDQLVFLAGGTIQGMDPANGQPLWAFPHDPGNDLNCGTPIWGDDNVLFVSSAYKAGSRAIQLRKQGASTIPEELWFTNRVRYMFLNSIRIGDYVYGTTGDFGPAFLTALNIKTGQSAWQHRGFGRASIVYADGKAIIMDEDGDLALAKLTPEGATILSEAKIFNTISWTAPTLVGSTLYARDREKIVALDLGQEGIKGGGAVADANGRPSAKSTPTPPVAAAPATFAGTWKLDKARSTVTPTAGLVGLIPAGVPEVLHITQPANGTVVVESQINEGHARMYRPGDKFSTPAGGGSITLASIWQNRTLVSDGMFDNPAGGGMSVHEEFSVTPDGTLTIQIATTGQAGKSETKATYTKIQSVGPCESWPTPCKRGS